MVEKIDELKKIQECIENNNNFLLSGGAGSGKTYSLVQTINFIKENYNNKAIACITYTNVAVNEIKNRVVDNRNLKVSTIHDFLWENIKHFQKELRKCIVELINEVIRTSNVVLKENNIEVELKVKEPVMVFADDFYIDQVVTNYFTNAIKHAEEVDGKKQIQITIEEKEQTYRVCVFNTGKQIEEENLDRIWGRFYKVDSSRNRENSGSGIGLALVKAIQNNYQNDYGVENKENGVEFYFEINQYINKKR